jgi:hypothetical protein
VRHRWLHSGEDGVPYDPQPDRAPSDFVWATCLGCGTTILVSGRSFPDRCHREYRIGDAPMPEECEMTVVLAVMGS